MLRRPSEPRRLPRAEARRNSFAGQAAGGRWFRYLTRAASRTLNWLRLSGCLGHRRRIAASRRVLRKVRSLDAAACPGRVFGYLRAIDPLVYEETVLSALEDAGAVVLRNRRYTGDGGIDGRCWLPGAGTRWLVVQCKRYASAITPRHVSDFCSLVDCRRDGGGLFVHCGRTRPLSYAAMRSRPIHLISGERLIDPVIHARVDVSRVAAEGRRP